MKSFNEWLNEARTDRGHGFFFNKRIKCSDGYSVSIQASDGHYCQPRISEDDISVYTAFELGFPSSADKALLEYAEDIDKPTDTVYGYVPLARREGTQGEVTMHSFTSATMYVDRFTGKQYLVQNGYSGKVKQYAPGVQVWFDGSCKSGGQTGQQIFKSRKDLNSWLKMMGFKK